MKVEAYGNHPLQTIKVFHFEEAKARTVVFIHGGAWRDPSNTYDDFDEMVRSFMNRNAKFNLIGINYRLSPEFKHPTHLIDIVLAMRHIVMHYGRRIDMVGHSVGATLIMQLLNAEQFLQQYKVLMDKDVFAALVFVKQIVWKNVFLIDGIYDIVQLVKEYPLYSLFVNEAFTNVNDYADASQLSNSKIKFHKLLPKIFVLQSVEDELLSLHQTNLLVDHLRERNLAFNLETDQWGQHEQVYRNDAVAEFIFDKCKK
jgi:kynurenine formamidase